MQIIKPEIIQELYEDAGSERVQRAKEYVEKRKVGITKVTYEDSQNFEVRAKVRGNYGNYQVYIHIKEGQIEELSCDCKDHERTYGSCKHIIATLMEFSEKEEYVKLFAGITANSRK